jgi:hypothetical protein
MKIDSTSSAPAREVVKAQQREEVKKEAAVEAQKPAEQPPVEDKKRVA